MATKSHPTSGSQVAALIAGSFLSGAMMDISLIAVPVLLDTVTQPAHLLQQWGRLYYYGHKMMPTLGVAVFTLYGYAAIKNRAVKRPWRSFLLAGIITLVMVPFTLIIMRPLNNTMFELEAANKETPVIALEEAQKLLVQWRCLHVVRSLFPLAGAALGSLAIFGGFEF
ncbi:uncharacterized protein K452DRAFT_312112 [Aplosporella prunicola CBS 121167]|uniref:DUF1772 domain-containing protein n=1 Tax=Aplosporella prunicola CBS 121167 TaxID=1176127 RepID=A0A6A6B0M8_9PEZI|nr:uncharacterized protein K452DRAFT_312112 [Aplosporella prunicola CBS 121167]KAF2137732.1 hypothetical protein K452DRAFT_312112 [Aplosporella prunicola CBS 121167]